MGESKRKQDRELEEPYEVLNELREFMNVPEDMSLIDFCNDHVVPVNKIILAAVLHEDSEGKKATSVLCKQEGSMSMLINCMYKLQRVVDHIYDQQALLQEANRAKNSPIIKPKGGGDIIT